MQISINLKMGRPNILVLLIHIIKTRTCILAYILNLSSSKDIVHQVILPTAISFASHRWPLLSSTRTNLGYSFLYLDHVAYGYPIDSLSNKSIPDNVDHKI